MLKSTYIKLEPNIPANRYFEKCSLRIFFVRLKTWISNDGIYNDFSIPVKLRGNTKPPNSEALKRMQNLRQKKLCEIQYNVVTKLNKKHKNA